MLPQKSREFNEVYNLVHWNQHYNGEPVQARTELFTSRSAPVNLYTNGFPINESATQEFRVLTFEIGSELALRLKVVYRGDGMICHHGGIIEKQAYAKIGNLASRKSRSMWAGCFPPMTLASRSAGRNATSTRFLHSAISEW
jgi:hypothetical protein